MQHGKKTLRASPKKPSPPARIWMLTLNNPEDDPEDLFKRLSKELGVHYSVGQLEKGENGTLHIQGYFNFSLPRRLSALKKVCPRGHWEKVRNDPAASNYCMKEDTRVSGPWTVGTPPVRMNSKVDWDQVWDMAKSGKLEEIKASVRVQHYSKLKAIAKDHMTFSPMKDFKTKGVWIYGPAGNGKSRLARERYPGAYPKALNKWWDGYKPDEHRFVIMDDLDPEMAKCLRHHLKIWADGYPCVLENKQGGTRNKFEVFCITSQYSIKECFPDKPSYDAIRRRFAVTEVPLPLYVQGEGGEQPPHYGVQSVLGAEGGIVETSSEDEIFDPSGSGNHL